MLRAARGAGVGCSLGALLKLDAAFRSRSLGTRLQYKPELRNEKTILLGDGRSGSGSKGGTWGCVRGGGGGARGCARHGVAARLDPAGAPAIGVMGLAEGVPESFDLGATVAVACPDVVAAAVVGFTAAGCEGMAARGGAGFGREALLRHFAAITGGAARLSGNGLADDSKKDDGSDPASATHGNTPTVNPPILLFRTLATGVCLKNTVQGMRILRPGADSVDCIGSVAGSIGLHVSCNRTLENCKVLDHRGTVILSEAKDLVGVLGLV